MATTPANPDFDALVSHTLRLVRAKLADNLSTHSVILAMIKKHGGQRTETGGYEIQENLLYAPNTTVKSYRGYEPFDVAPQEGMTSAIFQWKQIAGTVTISGEEKFKNSGRSQIKNLLQSKIKQLEISFREELDTQAIGDGSGNGGRDLTGLDALVEDGTAWSTVGGIDSDDHIFWRNQFIDFSGFGGGEFAATDTDQVSVDGMRVLRRFYRLLVRGADKPHLFLTSGEVIEAYEGLAENKQRITTNKVVADMGFPNVEFKGVPMVWHDGIASDDLWGLNFDYLHFVVGKGGDFRVSEFVEPADQDASIAKMLFYGNFTVSNRARQGRVIGLGTFPA